MNTGLRVKFSAFLFPRRSDRWLTLLRIGLGSQVCLYSLSLRGDWEMLYTDLAGYSNRELAELITSLGSALTPRLGWLITLGSHFGIGEEQVVFAIWVTLLVTSCSLILGLFSRAMAVVIWFLYLSSVKSGALYSYGVDNFTIIGLFYLMLAPLPDRWSLDAWLWKIPAADPRRLGFHQRALQLHLCLIYLFGGISKATGPGWWDGLSLWRALLSPPYNQIPGSVVFAIHSLLPAAGILVVVLEVTYPVLIWLRHTRRVCLVAIVAVHLGIGFAMGLYLFASIMIVLNLAAFATDLWPARRRPLRRPAFAIDAPPAR